MSQRDELVCVLRHYQVYQEGSLEIFAVWEDSTEYVGNMAVEGKANGAALKNREGPATHPLN